MEKPRISIIIPVYNVEIFIDRCVLSLVNQTWQNLEIILIDDGSTDGSGLVCDKWAKNDGRVKVIHKENGGVSAARNTGLSIAIGDYIGFVDPDDYIELDMYEFLYNTLKENNADIAVCTCDDYVGNTPETQFFQPSPRIQSSRNFCDVLDRNESLSRELFYGIYITCNKLFSKEVCKNLFYSEKYVNGEDRLFAIKAILNANKIAYNMKPKYHYCHRDNSAGTKKFTSKDFTLIELCEEIRDLVKINAPAVLPVAEGHISISYEQLLLMLDKTPKAYPEYRKKLVRGIWLRLPGLIKEKIPTNAKIGVVLTAISPKLYKFVESLYWKIFGR